MATNEQLIPIPGRLHSLASEGHVAGADEIYDDTQGKLQSTINTEKADKSATVSDVSYDTTNKKIQQTINGTTTDVVSVSTLKTDMSLQKSDVGLGNVENKSSATIRGELTSSDVTTALGYTPPQQDTTYSVMGASGSTHASGLVPDTPSTAGTTKFLREDGTWQEVNAAPEVQLGGNTPSSESDIKLFVDESADDTVEVYTKAQTNGQFVVIVNMNTEPTSSTLTYTATDGTTKNFKVGDEVRIPDAEADNGYTFYKLYAIVSGEAVWDKLGAGGSVNLVEYLTVSLTSNQTNPNSDLIGATVVITDTESSETLFSTTWQGTDLEFEIPTGTEYQVTVGAVSGYATPAAVTHTAGSNKSRTDTFTYNTEVVTVTCSTYDSVSVVGKKVTINGTQYTLDSTGIVTTKIPYGVTYSVVAEDWSGYLTPDDQAFTASQASRAVSVIWEEMIGAFVEATDGTLFKTSKWATSGKTANSVVLITDNVSIRIALTQTSLKIHGAIWEQIYAYLPMKETEIAAKADYDGASNTTKIRQYNAQNSEDDIDHAAYYCNNFTFPDGTTKGYLPAAGQLNAIKDNKTVINAALSACGGTEIVSVGDFGAFYWSSTSAPKTSADNSQAWIVDMQNNALVYRALSAICYVLPVATY